jgi:SAM-dependent methyltransferase
MNTSTPSTPPLSAFGRYAAWYDAFNSGKDYGAEVAYVLDRVKQLRGMPRNWLDIGCGTGHHLAHLKSKGIVVEGVDQSPTMIERARLAHTDIPFQVGTAQTLSLPVERDVISMLFHVMSYQISDDMVVGAMQRVREHLADDGIFVFDFFHTDGVLADPPTTRVREATVDGRSLFRLSRPTEDRAKRVIEIKYEFRWDALDGPLAHDELHVMRHFTVNELDGFLQSSRMRAVHSEGWMAHRSLSASDWYGVIWTSRSTSGY